MITCRMNTTLSIFSDLSNAATIMEQVVFLLDLDFILPLEGRSEEKVTSQFSFLVKFRVNKFKIKRMEFVSKIIFCKD